MSQPIKDRVWVPNTRCRRARFRRRLLLDPAQYESEIERIFLRSWMPSVRPGIRANARDYVV